MRLDGRLAAAAAALVAVVIWGVWFPVMRLGLTTGDVTPADMVVLRFSVGAIVLAPIILRRGLKAGAAGWTGTLVILMTLSGPFAFLIATGTTTAPAAHAAILVPGTFPALVFLLGLVMFRDPPSLRRWLGLLAVASGVGLIAWSMTAGAAGPAALEGYLYFHACAWMWAVYTVNVRRSGLSAVHALALTNVIGGLVWGPVWYLWGESGLSALPLDALAFQVGYHGLLNGLCAMFLYTFAVQRLGAAEGAVFAALVPCVAALSAWPILGEAVGLIETAALAAVSTGVVLISGARPVGSARP